ncbi:forkhead box protein H1 [Brachyhypopomus gauderio]|uniref:forkhead box protein H1 n=1 Tax=Brachyhypopomus gauderio TaxID=698409 RepID=UPI00404292E4
MTKLRGGPGLLAPPVTAYLPSVGVQYEHHLDFSSAQVLPRNAQQMQYKSNVARNSPGQRGYCARNPRPEGGFRFQDPAHDHLARGSASMENVLAHDRGSSYPPVPLLTADPQSKHSEQEDLPRLTNKNGNAGGRKKKNYQRYPKPPYSYLAMIAMVIQNSPEKKLTLSEILKEISTLFPFFKGNYKGWRDSVRHNLSSYDCFVKVLKDPGKPQGKGNFWALEVSRVPLELLKRQNTAVSRQDETIFAQDLSPYILQGHSPAHKADLPPPKPPLPAPKPPLPSAPPPPEDPYRPKLDSSFAIDSLLHSFRPVSTAGEGLRGKDSWGVEPPHNSLVLSRQPSSNHSASASSASPASSSSDEEWRGLTRPSKRGSDGEAGPDGHGESCPPPNKTVKRGSAPPWELPTSYAKYTPPNAVAPPSLRFSGGPFMPLGGIPFYNYSGPHVAPSHFSSHGYWPLLPSRHVSIQAPPLLMDLDRMLQSVPPNKSVFDVLGAVNHTVPSTPDQYGLQHAPSFSKYS